jgi:2-keto-4-pentenoate hydratase
MAAASPAEVAHHFVASRISGCHITDPDALPVVSSLSDAYEIQKAMVKITHSGLGAHCGWKAGATNAAARKTLGLEKPFRGPLFESGFLASPGGLSKARHNLNLLEPEFGFKLHKTLPNPCTPEQAWDAVEAVTLVIEACGTRCRVPEATPHQRVADGGIGSHVVLGPALNAAAARAANLAGASDEDDAATQTESAWATDDGGCMFAQGCKSRSRSTARRKSQAVEPMSSEIPSTVRRFRL